MWTDSPYRNIYTYIYTHKYTIGISVDRQIDMQHYFLSFEPNLEIEMTD